MKTIVISLICLIFFSFAMPALALEVVPEGGELLPLEVLGTQEATSSLEGTGLAEPPESPSEAPEISTESSPSALPKARLTPSSPFYFLKTLWEKTLWFLKRSPEARTSFALELAELRLAEALAVSNKFSLVERLFNERKILLDRAGQEAIRIAVNRPQREEMKKEILQQAALGGEVLTKIRETVPGEDTLRADNLSTWRDSWVAKLEEDLGPPLQEPSQEVVSLEATQSAESTPAAERAGKVSIWETLSSFLFGSPGKMLSPLAAPEGN